MPAKLSLALSKVSKYKTSKITESNPSKISVFLRADKSKLFGIERSSSQKRISLISCFALAVSNTSILKVPSYEVVLPQSSVSSTLSV